MSDISLSSLLEENKSDAAITHVTDSMKDVDLRSTIPDVDLRSTIPDACEEESNEPVDTVVTARADYMKRNEFVTTMGRYPPEQQVAVIATAVYDLDTGVARLEEEMNARFDRLEKKVDTRMGDFEDRMGRMEMMLRQILDEAREARETRVSRT
jgi:hypothetical protein